ncbi:hypothetical protein GCM10010254_73990 [Streptomyces chromofuscus]|nr:hypothetical protein GCM10010254_73990 [Streptomyces chromofuscus]
MCTRTDRPRPGSRYNPALRLSQSIAASAQPDLDRDTSGPVFGERFGSARDTPADRVGATVSAKRLDAARAATARPNTVAPQSRTSHPTRQRERHLKANSVGQSALAYEGGGNGGENEEVFGFALVAAVESPTGGQPGHGSLHDPAVPVSGWEDSTPLRGMRCRMPREESQRRRCW